MEGVGKRKRADAGSPPTPSSTGTQPEGKRSRRERRPSARFLERDVGNRGAFQRGGKRASKRPKVLSKKASTTADAFVHRENGAPSTKPKVVNPKVIEYIDISDDDDDPPPTQRTPPASTNRTQIECIEIDDSDAEGSSCALSPTSAPMTPGNMSNRDVPCSLRSEGPPSPGLDPAPPSVTITVADPSASLPSSTTSTAPPRFKHKADAPIAEVVEEPSQFLRDVQSLLKKRHSQNPSSQIARQVNYHDFSPSNTQPPPLFQSWVDRLIQKSGS